MEMRIITLIGAAVSLGIIWIFRSKRRRIGYLIPASTYFLMIIGFDILAQTCSVGNIVLPVQSLNFLSRVVRLVGIITVTAYVLIDGRKGRL